MEKQSIKVYEPELVIELGPSVATQPAQTKITCVECCGSRMFVGTLAGILIEYFVIEDGTGRSQYNKVREVVPQGGQPILLIRAASALESLIILSGNTLALVDSQSLELKGSNGVGNVTAVSIDENPVVGDPFVVVFCFSRKNSIHLSQATEKGFNLIKEINVGSFAMNLCMVSGLICAALANGYYIMINSQTNAKPIQLCMYDSREKPRVAHVNKEEFLVLGPGSLGVFVTKEGTSERPPISWPRQIHQITVHNYMNIVALGEDSVFVHSLIDYQTCHTIPVNGVRCLSLTEGNLYCGTLKSLFRLRPVSVTKQIEELLNVDEVAKALSLLEISSLKKEEQSILRRQINRKAVFIHLANFDFDAAKNSIQESNFDLREIVCLFPNILPISSTFTRSLPPLHNYCDVTAICKSDFNKLEELSTFVLFLLKENETTANSKDLATALVKLATQFDRANSFSQVLSSISQLNIERQDVQEWLEQRKFFNSSALIHKHFGEVNKALDIWMGILEKKIGCAEGDEFPGAQVIIDTLVEIDDPNIVWPYFDKLVCIHDPIDSVEIFKRKPISTKFPPIRVAERLKKWPDVCMLYLEDCVTVKDIQDEDCHTYLAILYVDRISATSDKDYRNQLRERLRQFLIDSNCLKIQFLIGKLQNTDLKFEQAILHGKAGDHSPALTVFTKELKDHKMAREYCSRLKNAQDRKEAFIDLFKIYLNSTKDLESPQIVVNLLCDFGEEFDLQLVLPMLPDDWSLEMVSNVFRRAIRNSVHKKRNAKLLLALSRRVNTDAQVEDHNLNEGHALHPESRCSVCSRTFDLIDPIFCEDGYVMHEKCK